MTLQPGTQQPPTPMSCAEFQENLPEIFASGTGGIPEDADLRAHLDSCDNCSTLVRDLQYIADEARMLLTPAQESPSENVWANIQNKMQSEHIGEAAQPLPIT